MQIVNGLRILGSTIAVLVSRTDDRAAFDPGAGQPDAEAR